MKSFSRLIGCAVLLLATGLILVALQLYARSDTAAADQYVLGVVATESEDEWHAMMLESILDSAAAQGFDVITLHAARSTDAQAEQVRGSASLVSTGTRTLQQAIETFLGQVHAA